MRQFRQQEEAEHAALAVGAERYAGLRGSGFQAVDQGLRALAQGIPEAGLLQFTQRRQAAGGGDRIARQRAGLVHRAHGRQLFHDGARPAKGRQRHAAADDLAQHGQVGLEAGDGLRVQRLGRAGRDAKTGHHLVQNQQRAMLAAQFAAALHEGHAGAHEVHVAGDRLDDDAGQLGAVLVKRLLQLFDVVVLQHLGVLHHLGRHAGAGGGAEGGQAGAGFDQERIGVAVVATFELDDALTPGGAARQAQCAHRGLGAGADQAQHFHAGHHLQDFFRQLDLALGRRAEGKAFTDGALHRVDHGRVAMAQDHRTPGAYVVDIALAIGVPEIGALGALHKARRAAYGLEGAYRGIDAAGDDAAGALEQRQVQISVGFH